MKKNSLDGLVTHLASDLGSTPAQRRALRACISTPESRRRDAERARRRAAWRAFWVPGSDARFLLGVLVFFVAGEFLGRAAGISATLGAALLYAGYQTVLLTLGGVALVATPDLARAVLLRTLRADVPASPATERHQRAWLAAMTLLTFVSVMN